MHKLTDATASHTSTFFDIVQSYSPGGAHVPPPVHIVTWALHLRFAGPWSPTCILPAYNYEFVAGLIRVTDRQSDRQTTLRQYICIAIAHIYALSACDAA